MKTDKMLNAAKNLRCCTICQI